VSPEHAADPPTGLEEYIGHPVVIDTHTPYVVLGTLKAVERDYLTIADADVHDGAGSSTTKDRYVMEAKKLGVCVNRREAKLRTDVIISVSRLDDVITF
jgi:hypothetical protein